LWNFIAIQVIQSLGVCIVYMELHSSFELGSKVLKFEKKKKKQDKIKITSLKIWKTGLKLIPRKPTKTTFVSKLGLDAFKKGKIANNG
jgi:hypothetical protein